MTKTIPLSKLEEDIQNSYEIPNDVLKFAPRPMVTVRTSTYQHGPYIKQCIESILAQKTNFKFEFIIGEDYSTDGTREIVMEYAKRYPHIIRVITSDKNVGMRANGLRCIRAIRGKYIALCEGDDYWTDPYKLQKQVDFMEKNPDYTICFHKVKVVYQDKSKKAEIYPDVDNESWYTLKELFSTNYIQNNSVLYRNIDDKNMPTDVAPGDWFRHLYYARFGKIKLINQVMSVYRKHSGGIWWDYDINRDKIWLKHGTEHLNMWLELRKLYSDKKIYLKIITTNIRKMIEALLNLDPKYSTDMYSFLLNSYPLELKDFIFSKLNELREKQQEFIHLRKQQEQELAHQTHLRKQQEQELAAIKSTLTWKVRTMIQKSAKKILKWKLEAGNAQTRSNK